MESGALVVLQLVTASNTQGKRSPCCDPLGDFRDQCRGRSEHLEQVTS